MPSTVFDMIVASQLCDFFVTCRLHQLYARSREVWKKRLRPLMVAALSLRENKTPQVRLELTTLRLRMFLCFHIGADYLINFPEGKLPGARGGLIGLAPQPLVSARSCLHRAFSTRLSAGFAQDCRARAR